MKIFLDLLWYFKREKRAYVIGVITLLVIAMLDMIPPYAVGLIVDGVKDQTLTMNSLLKWAATIVGVAMVVYFLRFLWRIFLFGASSRLARLLRNRLYEHFTKMSPQFFHQRRTGDLMAHATNDISAIELTAGDGVLTLVDSISMGSIVILTMATTISWKLTLFALLPMPIMAWASSRYGNMMHERFHAAQEAFSTINDKVQENISGVRVVKAFGQEEAEKADFKRLSDDVVEKNIRVAKIDALFDPTILLVVGCSYLLSVAIGARYVMHGEITLGELTQFTILLGHLIWPMLAFGWLFNIVERGRASYDRVDALLNVKATVVNQEGATEDIPTGELRYEINTFTYPEKETPALRDLHITLPQGHTLGIVGKTGAGKTTLLKLLLREFDVTNGDLKIGGTSIYDTTLSSLRSAVGYVPQDHFLFSATLAENIAFGRPEATQAEIEQAAKLACIHDDILHFAEGYATLVGERGVTLSGGQKQRISIARALLLNPEVLILDDSLSAVDAKTEKAILDALQANRQNKTTLISAHRLSAIEHAEQIIVLDDGAISERGTHDQLMNEDRWYATMYQRQQLESLVAQGGGADDPSETRRVSQATS
ncbi:ATP-binding cassette domain-containing protein [Tumebacillus sp. ITR2]|uniref:ATP-binding cassette domain-containing protein n=1 Tax=Tumebacillus amylolyticus TaxID=2801339 RepID=A0ABS1J535_9BACL|nr:ABC transporter transmembrane domain-containing protein [Tumebacillus amylolyticus]MBL0385305.1 ATP-binding cassette domain-containing protein [Tumebacillus amylolyticus]